MWKLKFTIFFIIKFLFSIIFDTCGGHYDGHCKKKTTAARHGTFTVSAMTLNTTPAVGLAYQQYTRRTQTHYEHVV